jgi:hypothetical protein
MFPLKIFCSYAADMKEVELDEKKKFFEECGNNGREIFKYLRRIKTIKFYLERIRDTPNWMDKIKD